MDHHSGPAPGRQLRWPLLAAPAGLLLALLAVEPGGVAVRSGPARGPGHLAYDPADLTAYALRGANAQAGRRPGRRDEPPDLWDPPAFAAALDAPAPPPGDRFFLEYPSPALGLFWLEAVAAGPAGLPPRVADAQQNDVVLHHPRTPAERHAWGRLGAAVRLHLLLMAAATVALGLVLRHERGVWLLALPGAVFFALNRYDVLPALATALAVRALARGRPGWAGAWLAVGAGLKLYPVLFLPVLGRLAGWRVLAGFAAAGGLIAGGCLLAVGWEGTVAPIRVQLERPPELGSWTLYDRLLPVWLAHSSAGRLGLLGLTVAACVATRPADLPAALRRCGLVLLAFTQLAVFWSPQWLVWFLPLAVPLAGRDRQTGWAAAAVDATNYLSFPVLFHVGWGELSAAGRVVAAEGLIAVRTLAWGWLGWRLVYGRS